MINVLNLTKRYAHHLAVDNVSFRCAAGSITGFLGPNGAGKSTTLRMLTGLTPQTSGHVTIDGSLYADLPNPGRLIGHSRRLSMPYRGAGPWLTRTRSSGRSHFTKAACTSRALSPR